MDAVRPFALVALLSGCTADHSTLTPPVTASTTNTQNITLQDCPIAEKGIKSETVATLLARARQEDTARPETTTPLDDACFKARLQEQVSAVLRTDQRTVVAKGSPTPTPLGELIVDFQADSIVVTATEAAKIKRFLAAQNLKPGSRIRVSVARGGFGNMFDQAVVAQQRARVVKELFPAQVLSSVNFDPQLAEDTVRVEVVNSS